MSLIQIELDFNSIEKKWDANWCARYLKYGRG
jgi:hypothetical protein